MIIKICTAVLLLIGSIQDIRKKAVSGVFLMGMLPILAFSFYRCGTSLIIERVLGLLFGGFLFAISILSREAIGRADCYVIALIGVVFGISKGITVLMPALLLSAVVGGFLFLIKKVGRKTRIPFIPFLCISYLGVWIFLWNE